MAQMRERRRPVFLGLLLVFAALIGWSLARVRHEVSGRPETEVSVTRMTTSGALARDPAGELARVERPPALPCEDEAAADTGHLTPAPVPAFDDQEPCPT